jgi:hypothetical protein
VPSGSSEYVLNMLGDSPNREIPLTVPLKRSCFDGIQGRRYLGQTVVTPAYVTQDAVQGTCPRSWSLVPEAVGWGQL